MISMTDWWKEAVVYQVYPMSFMDGNGDGTGDLRGITSKLDYLKSLGVDVIWLCPIYESPDVDNGYDVSDYKKISKKFGTMRDFDRLLSEVHRRGMKLIMDGVYNHTSSQHKWFIESRKSKRNRYRGYYIWRPPKGSGEPNNWAAFFGGSAWAYDKRTKEYYLHLFAAAQPDLNWDNSDVREEIYEIIGWWFKKGIDGMRFDAINLISKPPALPDAKATPGQRYANGERYFVNGPKAHRYLKEMNKKVLSRYDVMCVGEINRYGMSMKTLMDYVGFRRHELNMVFHDNSQLDYDESHARTSLERREKRLSWNLDLLKDRITMWQNATYNGGWDTLYLGNHDYPRIVSHFGDDGKYRVESAKMLATFLLTLRGTPYIYQGEELGMTNMKFGSISEFNDVFAINMYKEYARTYKKGEKTAIRMLNELSRDSVRTPMQWDGTRNAGFSKGRPWLRVNPNYKKINASDEVRDNDSVFNYYRKLIRLRKSHKVLVHGKYDIVLREHKQIYAYTRKYGKDLALVVLNFSRKTATFNPPKKLRGRPARLLISNYKSSGRAIEKARLMPYGARVYLLKE